MARQPRLVVPDIPLHIVQRGNDRIPCFREDDDYRVYLALLRELVRTDRCALHAYCLMSNHVHLLLTPATSGSCSSLMRSLSHRYAQYFNRKYIRTGTLWEGRFRSCAVESATYILACHRYIELNPVRAAMVRNPEDYPWSSYRITVGIDADPSVVAHGELSAIGVGAYEGLVREGVDHATLGAIRDATNGGFPLASQAFLSSLRPTAPRRLERMPPGPKRKPGSPEGSVPDPDLFEEIGA